MDAPRRAVLLPFTRWRRAHRAGHGSTFGGSLLAEASAIEGLIGVASAPLGLVEKAVEKRVTSRTPGAARHHESLSGEGIR